MLNGNLENFASLTGYDLAKNSLFQIFVSATALDSTTQQSLKNFQILREKSTPFGME